MATSHDMFFELDVAPHVGAWIEIFNFWIKMETNRSHPTWVRGLKSLTALHKLTVQMSHPTWVRGLKYGKGSGGGFH